MSLIVHPDPQEPAGGFAFLELPGGSLRDGPVRVAVQEAVGGRWLGPEPADAGPVGDPRWQGQPHDFGPYAVHRHQGADWVRIGPEIVDRIAEYAPLRIVVDGRGHDATWPDDVVPRAGAARPGGIRTRPGAGAPQPGPPVAAAPPEIAPEPARATFAAADPAPQSSRRRPWLAVLLVLAALAAGWLLIPRQPPVEPVAGDIAADRPPPDPDRCTPAALGGIAEGFAAVAQAIRDCGRAVSPDTALRLVEDAAARGDPAALALFGTLYDGDVVDPRIENLIGLSFPDDPARAAEYYARAVAAGSATAKLRLSATCSRLAGATETLEKGAHDDFCR